MPAYGTSARLPHPLLQEIIFAQDTQPDKDTLFVKFLLGHSSLPFSTLSAE